MNDRTHCIIDKRTEKYIDFHRKTLRNGVKKTTTIMHKKWEELIKQQYIQEKSSEKISPGKCYNNA